MKMKKGNLNMKNKRNKKKRFLQKNKSVDVTEKAVDIKINNNQQTIAKDIKTNNNQQTVTKPTTAYVKPIKPVVYCHSHPVEVIPGLVCGSEREISEMIIKEKVSVLVPLASCSSNIWNLGFRGEIYYYPTPDYSVLPIDVLEKLCKTVINKIEEGKKVGVFCFGGHGRTGYISSIIIGKTHPEIDDPIEFLRGKYCKSAVEANNQVEQIAEVLNKPELIKKHNMFDYCSGIYDNYLYAGYGGTVYQSKGVISKLPTAEPISKKEDKEINHFLNKNFCGDCWYCSKGGFCELYKIAVPINQEACFDFFDMSS